jgi:hypothetical protein
MHREHDHDHPRDAGHRHPPGPGHNHARPRETVQWQAPHRSGDRHHEPTGGEPDLDLVEAAFVDGFTVAADPTSFLRLARVPFDAKAPDGGRLVLLRVEVEALTDVGAITPHLGGGSFRYDPLPGKIVSRRRRLRFVYFDGGAAHALSLGEVRVLVER